jgi:ribosomal protein S18 acetylase RimI-like enzyme
MVTIELRRATLDDAPLLATLNRQLIEDERSRNPMSDAELEARMRGWLAADWTAVLIVREEAVVGYALYQERHDPYFPARRTIYLRQLFVGRDQRGRGVGRAAIATLLREWFPADATVELDVLETNPAGQRFWRSVGFAPYATTYQRPPAQE